MSKAKRKEKVFRSINEFQKDFFPKSFEDSQGPSPADAEAVGATLARASLETIREQLGMARRPGGTPRTNQRKKGMT